ncbi:MAG TPA: hypothetical protein IGS53_26270 [Leptolyngbyaceae cyanobacterium M33_DOE_097]|nr:hypothetical protein [Leptolyngbyaceae cyanobacterium M33_DOE_097]
MVEKLKTSVFQRYLWGGDRPPSERVSSSRRSPQCQVPERYHLNVRLSSSAIWVRVQCPRRCQGAIAIALLLSEPCFEVVCGSAIAPQ